MPDMSLPKTPKLLLPDSPTGIDNVYTQSDPARRPASSGFSCPDRHCWPIRNRQDVVDKYGMLWLPERLSRILGFMVSAPANADSTEISPACTRLVYCTLGRRAGREFRGVSDGFTGKAALISSVAIVAGSVFLGLSAKGIRINIR